jgi:hypothetical protein
MCERNVLCTMSSNVATGSQITYDWNITDTVVVTNDTTFQYTFTSFGIRLQSLVATNAVSRRVYSQNITISERVTGLQFCSGLYTKSASIVGQEANFLLFLSTGRDYTCMINFGDSKSASIDYISSRFGSFVAHNYTTEVIHNLHHLFKLFKQPDLYQYPLCTIYHQWFAFSNQRSIEKHTLLC